MNKPTESFVLGSLRELVALVALGIAGVVGGAIYLGGHANVVAAAQERQVETAHERQLTLERMAAALETQRRQLALLQEAAKEASGPRMEAPSRALPVAGNPPPGAGPRPKKPAVTPAATCKEGDPLCTSLP